jgi:hypothetical protein
MGDLPIDEMLLELRAALEGFSKEPCSRTLDAVFAETRRIADTCETVYVEMEDD